MPSLYECVGRRRARAALILAACLPAWCAAAPRLVCEAPVFDFGEADNSQTIRHDFLLRNTGDVPLTLGTIRSACGCIAARSSTNALPPGGRAPLAASFDLRGRSGPQRISIYVETNDPRLPVLQLQITGRARALVEINPATVTLARHPDGLLPTQQVFIVSHLPGPMQVLAVRDPAGTLAVGLATNTPGRAYTLSLALAPSADEAVREGVVEVTTDAPERRLLHVPFSVSRQAALHLAPAVLVFDPDAAAPQTSRLFVRSPQRRGFAIRRLACSVPGTGARLIRSGEFWHYLEVGPLAPGTPLEQAELTIETDLPGVNIVRVPLRYRAPDHPEGDRQ